MRSMRVPALVLGVLMLSTAAGLDLPGDADGQRRSQQPEHRAADRRSQHRGAADRTVRACRGDRPADCPGRRLRRLLPGSRSTSAKVEADVAQRQDIVDLLVYQQTLFPGLGRSIGLCRCQEWSGDRRGRQRRALRRRSRWRAGPTRSLPFFADVLSLPSGWLYQSNPYFSEETNEWVVANGTAVMVDGDKRGLFYFETPTRCLAGASCFEREGTRPCVRSPSARDWSSIDSRSTQVSEDRLRPDR